MWPLSSSGRTTKKITFLRLPLYYLLNKKQYKPKKAIFIRCEDYEKKSL